MFARSRASRLAERASVPMPAIEVAAMTKDDDLRAEVEALRREVEALRAAQSGASATGETGAESGEAEASAGFTDQLLALSREISEFTEETEKSVISHPLSSVLGALVLGILIGRVLPR